ncbi:mandelate racemase/muconate lactonizing enzyme family protein [Halomonas kalidii]|uniref:Enolase C-terminal domain-like protein n=1 Tax=Halomonas kalidii TaxID=3043293 RepID=A0ABT6VMU9_9GAMM|nr:enolase C-terminal domain-like protein [Halomonas kalidii]MDI5935315.1 enolase C-terminal domain-like protein [Halomonas kalidii]
MTETQGEVHGSTQEVRAARAYWLRVPLKVPYENALCRLESFDVMVIKLVDGEGRVGWGEACPVTGYSPETPEQAWHWISKQLPGIVGAPPKALHELLDVSLAKYPFEVSAVLEGLADLARSPLLHRDAPPAVRLLGTVNTLDKQVAPEVARQLLEDGYTTLKVKVGYDPREDAERVCRIAEVAEGKARLRMDANQGYSLADAIDFAQRVPADAVEVFEQPVPADRWDQLEAIGRLKLLPLMLDESIYDDSDIRRAATLDGVAAVKLKMSKSGGPQGLADQVSLCRSLGLDVVVGNGVASDLGCFHEAVCFGQLGLDTAAEMNGFLKTTDSLLDTPLSMHQGRLQLPNPRTVAVDQGRLASLAIDTREFS